MDSEEDDGCLFFGRSASVVPIYFDAAGNEAPFEKSTSFRPIEKKVELPLDPVKKQDGDDYGSKHSRQINFVGGGWSGKVHFLAPVQGPMKSPSAIDLEHVKIQTNFCDECERLSCLSVEHFQRGRENVCHGGQIKFYRVQCPSCSIKKCLCGEDRSICNTTPRCTNCGFKI